MTTEQRSELTELISSIDLGTAGIAEAVRVLNTQPGIHGEDIIISEPVKLHIGELFTYLEDSDIINLYAFMDTQEGFTTKIRLEKAQLGTGELWLNHQNTIDMITALVSAEIIGTNALDSILALISRTKTHCEEIFDEPLTESLYLEYLNG